MRAQLRAGWAQVRACVRAYRQPLLWVNLGVVGGMLVAIAIMQVGEPSSNAVLRATPPTPSTSNTAADPEPSASAVAPSEEPPVLNRHVQPGELSIPSIGVESAFVKLGLNRDGSLQAPRAYNVVGWYAGGPAPGDSTGPPAVIAGHVDSTAGPAVFFRLHDLAIGGDIAIRGADGAVRHFRVYKLATYPKDSFPAGLVYAPTGRAEVRLITCAGAFDRRRRSYQSNLVAYASIATGAA